MATIILFLLIGIVLGWSRLLPPKILSFSGKMMTAGIIILLASMGMQIGVDEQILKQLGSFGGQAFVFAVAAIAGSIVVVYLFERYLIKTPLLEDRGIQTLILPDNGQDSSQDKTGDNMQQTNPYRMTFIILGAFVLGILAGIWAFPEEWVAYLPFVITAALDLTLLAVGIDLGSNREVWKQIIKLGWRVLLVPLGIAIGSIAAGLAVGKLLGWTYLEGGAVAAGFGWYSLSGILISDLHSVSLGTVAFLSNVMREVLAILLIPVIARKVGPLTVITPGGATSMDTTLPIISAVSPPGTAVIAFVNGVILSASVPVLVPFLLR